MFRSHGSYELEIFDDGRIVKATLTGEWNDLVVRDYFEDLRKLPLAGKWVAIADLTDWGGGTPEMQEAYLPVIDWCIANGEIANAHISSGNLKMVFVNQMSEYRSSRIPQVRFASEEDAFAWARERLED